MVHVVEDFVGIVAVDNDLALLLFEAEYFCFCLVDFKELALA